MADRGEYVDAIRADRKVGKGSRSSIDECYDDDDLWELVKDATSAAADVEIARTTELHFLERGLDQRWGEDDDPQLLAYNEFKNS